MRLNRSASSRNNILQVIMTSPSNLTCDDLLDVAKALPESHQKQLLCA